MAQASRAAERRAIIQKTCGTTTRVDENVYIGGYLAAADADHVREKRFSHILKLFPDDESYPGGYHRHEGVEYFVVEAEDAPDYPLDRHFARCLQFIQGVVREKKRVLVHCHAGVSRSSTIVLLHLMINNGLTLPEAWTHLKRARPVVNPNKGFWGMLVDVNERATRFRKEGRAPERPNLSPAPDNN